MTGAAAGALLGALLLAMAGSPAHAAAMRAHAAAMRARRRTEPAAAVVQLRVVGTQAPAGTVAAGRARHPSVAVPPLADRVAVFVSERRALFEAPAPAAGPRAVVRPLSLVRSVDEDVLLRRRLADSFRPELARAGEDAPALLDALEAATSWRSWNHLHVDLGRSSERAARAMELLVRGILGGAHLMEDRS
jgi:hypothetical protein